MMTKRLYILAGANGSGKSTISKVLLPTENIAYINPDDIAKELNPADPIAVKISAGKATLSKVERFISEGKSFAIESTLSGLVYMKILASARQQGYETFICYTFVDSPEVCFERIESRVRKGGHSVPCEDVRRRYYRSKRNFLEAYSKVVDHWMLCYNGGTTIEIVAVGGMHEPTAILLQNLYEKFKEDL